MKIAGWASATAPSRSAIAAPPTRCWAATKKPSPTLAAPSSSIPAIRNTIASAATCVCAPVRTTRRSPTTPRRCSHRRACCGAIYGRGQAHLALGNGEPALADFNEALRLKPDSIQRAGAARTRQQPRQVIRRGHRRPDGGAGAIPNRAALLPKERAAVLTQRAFALAKADRASRGAQPTSTRPCGWRRKSPFTIAVAGLVDEKQGRMTEARDAYNASPRHRARTLRSPRPGLDRIGSGTPASSGDPSRRQSEPPAKSEPVARAAEPSSDGDTCAKYVPEIGRTVKIKCAD